MEKIITVTIGEIESNENNEWVKLTDHEDKAHRVFPSVTLKSGERRDLSGRVADLKAQIECGTIHGKCFKLIKEQKDKYWNVINVIDVEPAKEQAVADKPPAARGISPQEEGMWYKEVGEFIRTGTIKDTPMGRAMKMTYFARMSYVLGITVEDKETLTK